MNSKVVMTSAAIVLGLGGITCLFLPQEILKMYYRADENMQVLPIQLLGASFLGFAALDWVSRKALLGGIYGRPVVGTNYTHFLIGSLLLVRAAMSQPGNVVLWCTVAAYALFAIAFGVIFFGPPPGKDTALSK
jgi:hypothetical protein